MYILRYNMCVNNVGKLLKGKIIFTDEKAPLSGKRRENMKTNKEYFVMPYGELEASSYPTLSLVEWLAQPHKSFKKACKIADELARKVVYNGRLVCDYVVVAKSDKFGYQMEEYIRFFQDEYEVLYKASPYSEGEYIPNLPHSITSVWESHTNDEMTTKHGQSYFDQYFDWVQNMRKCDGYNIAWFADVLSAARFLKKEWANANEFVVTVQKNGQRIKLSNQFFRFGNVLSAQCVANWLGKGKSAYYNWNVDGKAFPSYGDAVIYVLESDELSFDDITKTKSSTTEF